jgi:hypothetical protein
MLKCPFCHFDNEDGALFCEQCKSDLTSVAPSAPAPAPIPMAMPEPIPLAPEPLPAEPMEILHEAIPLPAEPLPAEPMPMPALSLEEPPPPMAVAEPMPMELVPMPEPMPMPMPEPMPAPAPMPAPVAPAPMPAPVAVAPAPAPMAAPAPAAPAPAAVALPAGASPQLLVLRGQKRNVKYDIFEGLNFIGRADEKPVDIDLEDQEPPDRVWCSRQHACISFESNELSIEDLNSANGTYVNRTRVYPGSKRPLAVNDVVQIGNVQMKVVV